jgi:Ca2+-binding EF-hand superfamily protein
VRLSLLRLFDVWDANGDGGLDLSEVVWGMSIAGLKCDARAMAKSIYEISLLTGDVAEEDLMSLKNHEFVTFMLQPDMLGGRPPEAQLKCVNIILMGLEEGGAVAKALRLRTPCSQPDADSQVETRKTRITRADFHGASQTYTEAHPPSIAVAHPSSLPSLSPSALSATSPALRDCHVHSSASHPSHIFFDVEEAKVVSSFPPCLLQCAAFCGRQHKSRLVLYFLAWWLGGTMVYCLANGWQFYQGLYYAIQAGFSIGFGSLSEEKHQGVNSFEKCVPQQAGGGHNTTTTALINLVAGIVSSGSLLEATSAMSTDAIVCVTQFNANANVSGSMLYSIVHLTLGAVLIGAILSYFSASSIEQSEQWFQDAEDDRVLTELNASYAETGGSLRGRGAYAWGVAKLWIGDHRTSVATWCSLVVWLVFGAVVFEINEGGLDGAPLLKGLYTAFSAASTAGLAGPTPDNPASVVFMCFWCTIGVPLYAYSLGEIANVFTMTYVQQKGKEKRLAAVTEREYAWMNRLGDGDGEIDKFEYAMLWFLRCGLIEPEHIEQCVQDFDDLDADSNGVFSKSEMQASAFFQEYDADKDGELTMSDLRVIAKGLQKVSSVEYPGSFLLDPSMNYDDGKLKGDMLSYDKERRQVKVANRKSVVAKTSSKVRVGEFVSLNRREFMRWWSEDFMEYTKDATKHGMLARAHVKIAKLLDAIEEVQQQQQGP